MQHLCTWPCWCNRFSMVLGSCMKKETIQCCWLFYLRRIIFFIVGEEEIWLLDISEVPIELHDLGWRKKWYSVADFSYLWMMMIMIPVNKYICAKDIGCTGLIVWLHGFSKEHGKVMIFKWKHQGLGLVVAEMKILGCGCVPIHFFVYLEDLMYKMMAWIRLIWTYQKKKEWGLYGDVWMVDRFQKKEWYDKR